MIILIDSFGDYMVLTLKNSYIRNRIMYIVSIQIVIVTHNTIYLLAWSVNLILL
jgi:hypothetical protein